MMAPTLSRGCSAPNLSTADFFWKFKSFWAARASTLSCCSPRPAASPYHVQPPRPQAASCTGHKQSQASKTIPLDQGIAVGKEEVTNSLVLPVLWFQIKSQRKKKINSHITHVNSYNKAEENPACGHQPSPQDTPRYLLAEKPPKTILHSAAQL